MRFSLFIPKVLFLALGIIFSFNMSAQSWKIDSIKQVLKKCKVDTQKIMLRNELCKFYAYSKPDTALILLKEAFALARTDDHNGLIANSCMYAGISYNNLGNRDSGEFYFNRAIQIAHRHKKTSVEAASYMGLGTCYNFWKKQDKALKNYMKSYDLYKSLNDTGRMAAVSLGLGNVYSDLNNVNKSLEFYNLCLNYSEARNDSSYMARCYNNIGNLFQKNKNYEKALQYYNRSIDIKKALKDEHGIANTYLNFGNIYVLTKKIDLARFFYSKAKESYLKLGDSAEYMNSLNYIAECLLLENKVKEALAHLKEAEGICLRNHYTADLAGIYASLTRIYILQSDTGNARRTFEKYTATKDSILTDDMNRQIAEMTAQFENGKQKQELLLKEAELLASKKISNVYIIATALVSVFLLILVFVIIRLKKANALLQENIRQTAQKNKTS